MKIPLTLDRFKAARFVGVILLLVGVELQIVESLVLNEPATRCLVDQYGDPPATPQGAIQRFMVDSNSRRAVVTPPRWVGWSAISAGCVAFAYGLWGGRWK